MDTEKYFRKLGYDLAMGYDSIKLLKVSTEEIHFFQTMTKEEIRIYVDDIRETAQWEKQVISEIGKIMIPEPHTMPKYIIEFHKLENYVIEGYCDAIYNLTEK